MFPIKKRLENETNNMLRTSGDVSDSKVAAAGSASYAPHERRCQTRKLFYKRFYICMVFIETSFFVIFMKLLFSLSILSKC